MYELTTIGITLGWKAETQSGLMPAGDYTTINNITSIGDLGGDAEALEVTDLGDGWSVFISAVRGGEGKLPIGANFTSAFRQQWTDIVTASVEAKSEARRIWWKICVPDFGGDGTPLAFYFAGDPSELSSPGFGVDEAYEGETEITVNEIAGWTPYEENASAVAGIAIAGYAIAGWSPS